MELFPFDDFDNAVGVNPDRFRLTEEKNHLVIFGSTDASGFRERVLRAVVQTHSKRSKRFPFHQVFDFLGFYRCNLAQLHGGASSKPSASWLARPAELPAPEGNAENAARASSAGRLTLGETARQGSALLHDDV